MILSWACSTDSRDTGSSQCDRELWHCQGHSAVCSSRVTTASIQIFNISMYPHHTHAHYEHRHSTLNLLVCLEYKVELVQP